MISCRGRSLSLQRESNHQGLLNVMDLGMQAITMAGPFTSHCCVCGGIALSSEERCTDLEVLKVVLLQGTEHPSRIHGRYMVPATRNDPTLFVQGSELGTARVVRMWKMRHHITGPGSTNKGAGCLDTHSFDSPLLPSDIDRCRLLQTPFDDLFNRPCLYGVADSRLSTFDLLAEPCPERVTEFLPAACVKAAINPFRFRFNPTTRVTESPPNPTQPPAAVLRT